MAYTKVGTDRKIRWNEGHGGSPNFYLHPVDLTPVMSQEGATAFSVRKALVKKDGIYHNCHVIFAVGTLAPDGYQVELTDPEHYVAVSCPEIIDTKGDVEF